MIYEVDSANMGLKSTMIRRSGADLRRRIRCLESDLRNTADVVNTLKVSGWDDSKPSLLVFEGISYYLDRETMSNLVSLFATEKRQNVMILEYLLENDLIRPDRRHIPRMVFDIIKEHGSVQITRYAQDTIQSCFKSIRILEGHTLKDMEKCRCGYNRYFKTDDDGWINVLCATV